jgi:hypothetical protein
VPDLQAVLDTTVVPVSMDSQDRLDLQVVPDHKEQQAHQAQTDLQVALDMLAAPVPALMVVKVLRDYQDLQVVSEQLDLQVAAEQLEVSDTLEVLELAIQDQLATAEVLARKDGQVVPDLLEATDTQDLDIVQIKLLQRPAVLDLEMCI